MSEEQLLALGAASFYAMAFRARAEEIGDGPEQRFGIAGVDISVHPLEVAFARPDQCKDAPPWICIPEAPDQFQFVAFRDYLPEDDQVEGPLARLHSAAKAQGRLHVMAGALQKEVAGTDQGGIVSDGQKARHKFVMGCAVAERGWLNAGALGLPIK